MIEKSKSIREQVYENLKKLIIDGTIPPGERVKEIEYSQKFKISRTPVREAIRMLELEGLVENNQSGGVVVRKISYEELYEIYRIRVALEDIILEEVIKTISQKDIKKLEDILSKTQHEIETNTNDQEVFKCYTQFNTMLYKISGFKRISNMIDNINLYLEKIRKMAIEDKNRKIIAFNDHKKILEAIKEKNLEKALCINKQHLSYSMNFIVDQFGNDLKKNKKDD